MRIMGPVGDNATLLLPREGVVLRVTPRVHLGRVRRELAIARWLLAESFPVVRPLVTQPLTVDGHVVTVWEAIPDPVIASPADLGALLRRLHELCPSEDLELPALDPFRGVEGYLNAAVGLSLDELRQLRHLHGRLRTAFQHLVFELPSGPVHGDAHRKNAIRGSDGRVVLLDLERFSTGPREWDLIVAAVYVRLGWYSPADYTDFVRAYGTDVREWVGFETLAAIRELRMTAWLCARTGREPHLLPEARKRIASLLTPSAPRHWTPGT
ncbi:hypothetical protein ABH917_001007 [Thermobifida halotolerans]